MFLSRALHDQIVISFFFYMKTANGTFISEFEATGKVKYDILSPPRQGRWKTLLSSTIDF